MREKERATRIIFVRHGKTDFPIDRIYCDDVEDPDLNAEGLAHATAAAEWLREAAVDAIYASPSARTASTARQIAGVTGLTVQFSAALRERPFGIWSGLHFDDIAEKYPADYQAWKQDPIGFVPRGGESINALSERVVKYVATLVMRHPGQTVVVVAHVGPIRVCIADAMTMPLARYRQLTVDYGSLSRVDFGTKQNNLVYLNAGPRRLG